MELNDKEKFISGNVDEDFFEANPQFKYIGFFSKKINDYGEKMASDLCWAAYMYMHPESQMWNMKVADRYKEITTNFLKPRGSKIDKREFEKFTDEFMRVAASYKARVYRNLKEKLMEVVEGAETSEEKIDLLNKFAKMYDSLETAENAYNKEKDLKNQSVRGDKQVNSALSRLKKRVK